MRPEAARDSMSPPTKSRTADGESPRTADSCRDGLCVRRYIRYIYIYMCVCVCVFVCMCVCVYVCMCVCVYVCMCVCVYVYLCIFWIYVPMYVLMYVCMYVHAEIRGVELAASI
jgi:hypothetical protein